MTESENGELAYNLDVVAKKLGGVTRRYVEILVAAGELPSFKLGGRRLVHREDLDRFVNQLRDEALAARKRGAA